MKLMVLVFMSLFRQMWSYRHLPRKFMMRSLFSSYGGDMGNEFMDPKEKKFIVVTGGVISGIGKGITASSVGVVLKMLGIRPTAIKIDPYLNVDAGTMSPFEHGETFVLDDGTETDLDLGNYERFLDVKLTNASCLTTGKVYQTVIKKERKGEYLGKTVQIIPHITDEIMSRLQNVFSTSFAFGNSTEEPDVSIIELGGTIGDIESMPFVEAIRQLQLKVKPSNLCLVHVSMVPSVGENGEQKTKPTQHSVKELRGLGLTPDFIVCRSKLELDPGTRSKISLFCNVPQDNVLSMYDLKNIYHAPLLMIKQNFHRLLAKRLSLPISPDCILNGDEDEHLNHTNFDLSTSALSSSTASSNWSLTAFKFYHNWKKMAFKIDRLTDEVAIGVIGKYTNQADSYVSLINAIKHSCVATDQKLKLVMIESSNLDQETFEQEPDVHASAWEKLKALDGLVIPGGFGYRGVEGMIQAIHFAREKKIPFLGVCLGMQLAVVEYCRSQLGMTQANSEEFVAPQLPEDWVVIFMPEGSKDRMGATMRLGSRTTVLRPQSLAQRLYHGQTSVDERHRHRYEVNPMIIDKLEKHGLIFSGKDTMGQRMEILELPQEVHPYYVGVQFHPEYLSRPLRPAPVFHGLLEAAKVFKQRKHSS